MIWLLCGYLFLFIFRPFEYWPILGTLHIERIYMLLLIVAVFLNKEKRYIPHNITKASILFFVFMVVSACFAISGVDAYDQTYEYFKLLVFYFVVILCIRDEVELKHFLIAYVAIMFLYLGKSEWEFFIHDNYMYRMGIKRLKGIDITYGDPNYVAASVAYSLPFVWALFRCDFKGKTVKYLLLGYSLLAAVAIIYTGSRSGMVTSMLFLVFLWFGSKRKFLVLALMTAALAVGWVGMPDSYKVRFESILVDQSESEDAAQRAAAASAKGRMEGFHQGVKVFMKYPLLGIGPGNIVYGWDDMVRGPKTHNLYGILLGELGLLGGIAFCLLVVQILLANLRNLREIAIMLPRDLLPDEPPSSEFMPLLQLRFITVACIQTILLLLFNGNFGHNLYRYSWLLVGAITVLTSYFIRQRIYAQPESH